MRFLDIFKYTQKKNKSLSFLRVVLKNILKLYYEFSIDLILHNTKCILITIVFIL